MTTYPLSERDAFLFATLQDYAKRHNQENLVILNQDIDPLETVVNPFKPLQSKMDTDSITIFSPENYYGKDNVKKWYNDAEVFIKENNIQFNSDDYIDILRLEPTIIKINGLFGTVIFDLDNDRILPATSDYTQQGHVFKSYTAMAFNGLPFYIAEYEFSTLNNKRLTNYMTRDKALETILLEIEPSYSEATNILSTIMETIDWAMFSTEIEQWEQTNTIEYNTLSNIHYSKNDLTTELNNYGIYYIDPTSATDKNDNIITIDNKHLLDIYDALYFYAITATGIHDLIINDSDKTIQNFEFDSTSNTLHYDIFSMSDNVIHKTYQFN